MKRFFGLHKILLAVVLAFSLVLSPGVYAATSGGGDNGNPAGERSVAISSDDGDPAQVYGNDSAAIASGSTAYEDFVVSFGSDTIKRRLVNIADGIYADDAVTMSQFWDFQSSVANTLGGRLDSTTIYFGGSAYNPTFDAVVSAQAAPGGIAEGAGAVETHADPSWLPTGDDPNVGSSTPSVVIAPGGTATSGGAFVGGTNSRGSMNSVTIGAYADGKQGSVSLGGGSPNGYGVGDWGPNGEGHPGEGHPGAAARAAEFSNAVGQGALTESIYSNVVAPGGHIGPDAIGGSVLSFQGEVLSVDGLSAGREAKIGIDADRSGAAGAYSLVEDGVKDAFALASHSVADESNTVSVGNDNLKRRITNVDDAVDGYDAINKRSLDNAISATEDYADAAASGALSDANSYTDGEITSAQSDWEGYADTAASGAKTDAQTYTDSQIGTAQGDWESYADSASGTAEANAKGYTDTQLTGAQNTWEGYADTAAGDAQAAAKDYTDSELLGARTNWESYADGVADTAQAGAQSYTDTQLAGAQGDWESYADTAASGAQSAANTYTDSQISSIPQYIRVSTPTGSYEIGAGSVVSDPFTVSFGSSSQRRRLVNVADGVDTYDAVNVGQLNDQVSNLQSQIDANAGDISDLQSSGGGGGTGGPTSAEFTALQDQVADNRSDIDANTSAIADNVMATSVAQTRANDAYDLASQANATATGAADDAAAAQATADHAVDVANSAVTDAGSYADAAAASASQASGYADAAAGSAGDAATSAVAASGYASDANASAVAAAGSASDAADSAASASNSAEAAAGSAIKAHDSALAASNSANQAAGSAVDAADSANQASSSAVAAQNSADNAHNSEVAAAGSAGSAAASADNAAHSAGGAHDSAVAAQGSADDAAHSAVVAAQAAGSTGGSGSTPPGSGTGNPPAGITTDDLNAILNQSTGYTDAQIATVNRRIDNNSARIDSNTARLSHLEGRMDDLETSAYGGIAASIALSASSLNYGPSGNAMSLSAGQFHGQTALGLKYGHKIEFRNGSSLSFSAGVAGGTSGDIAYQAGIGFSW